MTELRTIRKGDTITVADQDLYPAGTEYSYLTVYDFNAVTIDETTGRVTILNPDRVVWDRMEVQL